MTWDDAGKENQWTTAITASKPKIGFLMPRLSKGITYCRIARKIRPSATTTQANHRNGLMIYRQPPLAAINSPAASSRQSVQPAWVRAKDFFDGFRPDILSPAHVLHELRFF